jgi:ATP-dependent RNA helicase DBP3
MQRREMDARRSVASSAVTEGEITPRVLILAPTRELAIQICKVLSDVTTKLNSNSDSSLPTSSSVALQTPIHSFVLYGGPSIETDIASLRSLGSVDILVSTPGRLLKHMDAKSISLRNVGFFVLDEADRMLDLGFENDLRTIDESVPSNRQTALFSATWQSTAQRAAATFLKRGAIHTVKVVIGSESLTAAQSVTQVIEVIDRRQGKREKRLLQLLEQYHPTRENRILIFVLYKKETGLLADHLNRHGWKAVSISGDHTQAQRLAALDAFRSGDTPILVATDVAARGIDIKGVSHVINFSLGLSVDQYIHRVGRCGRAGATGIAHTFIVDYDAPHTPALVKLLEQSQQSISPELREMAERAERQAAKHTSDSIPGSTSAPLGSDAYFASLRAGALSKNVNVAKQLAKQAEEDAIEAAIFGEDAGEGVLQKGKKQHAAQKHRGGAGGGGGAKKGKGRH